ncbi:MAG: glycosyltransferase family 2 protein, partial [Alistipes sp.]|nr:glycosyltransferase family 2 protein [Alistipes sp.]
MLTLKILFWVALFIVFYTYIGYGILIKICVWIKERFHPWQEPQAPEVLPEVTLMIAAYNEELVVAEKMKNTRQLEYPADRFKVVWVTDGSTDATNERLAEYEEVTVLYQPLRQGKTAALNRGMTFVKSPIVIFTDANTMLNPEAIREIVRQFSLPEVGCVAGEKRIAVQERDNAASGGEGLYWRYESTLKRLDWHFYSAMGAAGELFAVRRELFRPMEPDTLLDDFILSLRIVQQGYRIAYCDTAYAVEG